jgi:hypothetical protein
VPSPASRAAESARYNASRIWLTVILTGMKVSPARLGIEFSVPAR